MMYQDVLKMLPDYWNPMGNDVRFCKVQLTDPYSCEYREIKSYLEGSYFYLSTGIYRLQNPLLWAKFTLKKMEYERRGEFQIKTLYHDTCQANINSICEFNLDWRMGERFMFGPGTYFSVHPNIAFKHSSKRNGPYRAMFVCDVLVQKVQVSSEAIFLPDPGFDTVLAHKGQTYVKYFDCEFYPRYFMTYEAQNSFIL